MVVTALHFLIGIHRRIVSGNRDDTIKVWEAEKGKVKFTRKAVDNEDVAFSRDGKSIVAG